MGLLWFYGAQEDDDVEESQEKQEKQEKLSIQMQIIKY